MEVDRATEIYREFTDLSPQIGLREGYEKLTPGSKMNFLGGPAIDRSSLTKYLTVVPGINVPRTLRASLQAVRSGVAIYFRFCHLMGRPASPPTEDAVQLRITTFDPG